MIIGTVREIKKGENRVGLTPAGAGMLVRDGHSVLVESKAGQGSGFPDQEYASQGAKVMAEPKDIWQAADMIVKVKEPLEQEYGFLRQGLILFTYLHLAAEERLTRVLVEKGVIGVAYETVELDDLSKPLLSPMSEVAGRMAVQIGMHYLERTNGGSGKLLSGIPGVLPGTVTIIGSGMAGTNAARLSHALGAKTYVIGVRQSELRKIDDMFKGQVITLASNPANIEQSVAQSDIVIGTVAVTGAAAPRLVSRELVRKMKPGSVIVDVSIDQGGCFETSRPTSHAEPTYVEEGVTHYCVTNMPGAVPNTSTAALTNATLPYMIRIASLGLSEAARRDKALAKGINTYNGRLTNEAVARHFKLKYEPLQL
ncbi:alanine dehydrogenase [Candidatus Woesearchaeota archaeon]|nr:alanine dehydrogenase [Candidatus Woesearchaeota archaeon]